VVVGRKTRRERFAGAINTLACEGMMRDGKALQMGTSHEFGTNFAKAFGIEYLAASGQRELCWTTSWGSSTRMVGGLIMAHGDDAGLRVPPVLAPTQVVVMAVKAQVSEAAHRIGADLCAGGVRVVVDDRVDVPFGRRVVDWELKGVPLRLEFGPRDLAAGQVTVADRLLGAPKAARPLDDGLAATVTATSPRRSSTCSTPPAPTATGGSPTPRRSIRPSRRPGTAGRGSRGRPSVTMASCSWRSRRLRSAACTGRTGRYPTATPRTA
jgi:prolyl-tRNA synthetase